MWLPLSCLSCCLDASKQHFAPSFTAKHSYLLVVWIRPYVRALPSRPIPAFVRYAVHLVLKGSKSVPYRTGRCAKMRGGTYVRTYVRTYVCAGIYVCKVDYAIYCSGKSSRGLKFVIFAQFGEIREIFTSQNGPLKLKGTRLV